MNDPQAGASAPATGVCVTCLRTLPLADLSPALAADYRPIPWSLWCRDKEACYQAWSAPARPLS